MAYHIELSDGSLPVSSLEGIAATAVLLSRGQVWNVSQSSFVLRSSLLLSSLSNVHISHEFLSFISTSLFSPGLSSANVVIMSIAGLADDLLQFFDAVCANDRRLYCEIEWWITSCQHNG